MAGTKEGGLKAKAKNLAKDPNFYANIAKLSQEAWLKKDPKDRPPRGFAYSREMAREAGRKGGTISRRKGVQNKVQ